MTGEVLADTRAKEINDLWFLLLVQEDELSLSFFCVFFGVPRRQTNACAAELRYQSRAVAGAVAGRVASPLSESAWLPERD